MALLCLLLMAAFYLAVIIGQPQEDETASTVTPRTDQPLLSAGQDVVTITSADDLPLLLRMFPAPALTPTTSGWPLVVGTCYDVAFENGMGRILTLTYQASDMIQVTLTSIYPARAIALLEKGDYRISASLGATLAGLQPHKGRWPLTLQGADEKGRSPPLTPSARLGWSRFHAPSACSF